MPPFPMINAGRKVSMKLSWKISILADVVGPAAMTVHSPSTFFMMGPQWNTPTPLKSTGSFSPFSWSSRALRWASSLAVITVPVT